MNKQELEQKIESVASDAINDIYNAIAEMTDVDKAYEQILQIIVDRFIV